MNVLSAGGEGPGLGPRGSRTGATAAVMPVMACDGEMRQQEMRGQALTYINLSYLSIYLHFIVILLFHICLYQSIGI
jgi:hypothetical protein